MSKWSDVRKELRTLSDVEKDEIKDIANLVGDLIERRNQLGWTQQQLAHRAEVKQSAIARLESGGAIPRVDTLYKVAKALGMKVKLVLEDDLIDRENGTK